MQKTQLKSVTTTDMAVIGAGTVGAQRSCAIAFLTVSAKRPSLPGCFQLCKLPPSTGTLELGVIGREMIPAWLMHWHRQCGGVKRLKPCWRCRTIIIRIGKMLQSVLKDAAKQTAANTQEHASARF